MADDRPQSFPRTTVRNACRTRGPGPHGGHAGSGAERLTLPVRGPRILPGHKTSAALPPHGRPPSIPNPSLPPSPLANRLAARPVPGCAKFTSHAISSDLNPIAGFCGMDRYRRSTLGCILLLLCTCFPTRRVESERTEDGKCAYGLVALGGEERHYRRTTSRGHEIPRSTRKFSKVRENV